MAKKFFKELAVLIGLAAVIGTAIYFLLDGFDPLSDGTLDINVHDTYYVIANASYLLIPLLIILLFIIYLIRMLRSNYNSKVVNILFIVIGFLSLYFLIDTMIIFQDLTIFPGSTIYPPLSGVNESIEGNAFYYIARVIEVFIFFVIILMIFCAYKMERVSKVDR